MSDFGKKLIRGMKKFLRRLKSGKPIKATRVERIDTPDGPMHVRTKVNMPPEPSTYLDDAGEWQGGRRRDIDQYEP